MSYQWMYSTLTIVTDCAWPRCATNPAPKPVAKLPKVVEKAQLRPCGGESLSAKQPHRFTCAAHN